MNDPYNMKNKLYAHLDTLNMIVKNKPWHSFCLEIHPTNYCTHNCTDCTSSPYRLHHPKQYLPAPELFKVLKRFSQLQGKSILWSGGGEPCSYKCKLTNKRFLRDSRYYFYDQYKEIIINENQFLDIERYYEFEQKIRKMHLYTHEV